MSGGVGSHARGRGRGPIRSRAGRRRAGRGEAGIGLLLALLTLPAGCQDRVNSVDRIVLVTIDTLRADRVGAYGDLSANTPGLDGLAKAGVRFEVAIAPAPLTLPSHTSLMTALDPPEHGVRHNSVFRLDPEIPVVAEALEAEGYATAAFVAAFVLDARYGLDRGFDVYDDEMGERRASKSPFSFAERRADQVVDSALEWLETAPDRFFLWIHLYDPHADYDPPKRFLRRAGGDAYAGEIAFADDEVARLVATITRRWGNEGLVVAVTSDHGESLGEHRERTHSYTIYDATQRVPLILSGQMLPDGLVVREPVRLIDVGPTLLEFGNAEPLAGARGKSLLPLIRREAGAPPGEPRVAYVETLATQLAMGWSPLLGLRTVDHKYIRAPQPELYDLVQDPGELRNLALDRPQKVAELDALLEGRLEDTRELEAAVDLDAEARRRLESLGYVMPGEGALGRELGVVGGLNPRDHMLEATRVLDARQVMADGRPKEALELLRGVQSPGPIVAQTMAQAALAADEPERAVAAMEPLRARGEAAVVDLNVLGLAYIASGRHEEAREAFEAALEADPDAFGAYAGLARLAQIEGDLEAAERHLLAAQECSPQPEAQRVERATLRLADGRIGEADALLEGIGEEFLADPPRALRLARAEHAAGRRDRALGLLARSLADHPRHARLLSTYAAYLGSAGRHDEALGIWKRAYAEAPDDPGAKNDLAWGLALARSDLDRALALAREAASGAGDDPAVLDTLATVHWARDEPAESLAAADRALAGDPLELEGHLLWLRAEALADLDRGDEARAVLGGLAAREDALEEPWLGEARRLAERLGVDPTPFAAPDRPERAGSGPAAHREARAESPAR